MGYTLQQVKENQKHLSFNSFCVYKTLEMDKPELIPVPEVLCLANIGNNEYNRRVFTDNKPSDSYLERMLKRGVMVEENENISLSDKAKNAEYIFFCQIPKSRK